jgi:hypothetical protein
MLGTFGAFVNLNSTVRSFRALGMNSTIAKVLISLLNLNREIEDFDYFEVKRELPDINEVPELHKQKDNVIVVLKNIDTVLSNTARLEEKKSAQETEGYPSVHIFNEKPNPDTRQYRVARQVIGKIQDAHDKDIKQTEEDELEEE